MPILGKLERPLPLPASISGPAIGGDTLPTQAPAQRSK
jgi:hypothetical protein